MLDVRRFAPICAVLALGAGLSACAPAGNSTVDRYALGTSGYVSHGTIVGMRPVAVQGTRSGIGAGTGAVAGGVLGSTIGGDWRARAVGGVIGALAGGVAGAAIEEGVTRGDAMEFIIRDDSGATRSVIQTNELGLTVGDRVTITQGDRVRLSRAAGGAAPVGYGAAYGGGYGGGPVDARGGK
ncbi:glycine zipper 2TM domain-containing protein [Roseomonas eburnea]|uniref:17 kDa surface antigen n=1 Tax=Neoroseomonas eburnea TaxID=1346889 RepID=A0A9X9X744_9PROT|nr:glycine zipper 2TM domain-containing protein [Neoroseomonas eburnea]MBR0679530.1 glycine zipper 2TM domain-containing protein [Neoroseomonas eburnea]